MHIQTLSMNKKLYMVIYFVKLERLTKYFDTIVDVKEFTQRFARKDDFAVYEYDNVIGYRLTSVFW